MFSAIRRLLSIKSFDKVLGLDFPSSRMTVEKPRKHKNKVQIVFDKMKIYQPHNVKNNTVNNCEQFDTILGVDFPSSRFK
jgi:hypothetical protein